MNAQNSDENKFLIITAPTFENQLEVNGFDLLMTQQLDGREGMEGKQVIKYSGSKLTQFLHGQINYF